MCRFRFFRQKLKFTKISTMIIGIGNDLLEIARMEDQLRGDREPFRDTVFTSGEIAYCETKRHPAEHYAARFAAKEALLKALAVDGQSGLMWREAEILNEPSGRPRVYLYGSLQNRARELHVQNIFITLSHTAGLAAASVVLES